MSDQTLDQTPSQEAGRRYPNRYKAGQSGNPSGRPSRAEKRALVMAKAHELAEELGGYESLGLIERTLIERAAELLLRRPRRPDEVVKISNLVSRILRDCLRRHQTNKPPKDGLRQYLAEARR